MFGVQTVRHAVASCSGCFVNVSPFAADWLALENRSGRIKICPGKILLLEGNLF
jgi:hypothetical protein